MMHKAWIAMTILCAGAAAAQQPPQYQPPPQQFQQQPPQMPPMAPMPGPAPAMPAPVPPPAMTSEFLLSATSPYRSLDRTRRLVNEIVAQLALASGYVESTADAHTWKTAAIPGVAIARRLEKVMPDKTLRTIEFAVMPGASGDYRLQIYAEQAGAPNPDLAALKPQIDAMFQVQQNQPQLAQAGSARRDNISQHMYQLSYVQGDRAIGMLKALGYSTIEFTQAPGETKYETQFEPVRKGEIPLPVVVKLIDAAKTSLMDPFTAPAAPGAMGMPPPMQAFPQPGQRAAIPDIGGTYLSQITSGEPQERLLILYDENDPDSLERLVNVLHTQIDVAARQVVISALIVEADSNLLRNLGLSFTASNNAVTGTLPVENPTNPTNISIVYDSTKPRMALQIQARLEALVQNGEAEILSNPSVLVLDGRQARIQIGQQIPVVNSTATAAGITSSVDYFPVGIVLNLRPRISDDGSEVTMQVETIVSAVASTAPVGAGVLFAPTVDNRQVQTFVRVADSTPFIIGGLISTTKKQASAGIPGLSEIPWIGGLFRTTSKSGDKREVIVVLTPHVVPLSERDFSYVIPKDSDTFDSFGNKLFRNAYRLRARDVFDLKFVYESDAFQHLLARVRAQAALSPSTAHDPEFTRLLRGEVPGESILVRRMLWEIIRKTDFTHNLSNDRIIFFQPSPTDRASTDFVLSFFKDYLAKIHGSNAMAMSFEAFNRGTMEHPFAQPKADISFENVPKANYEKRLVELNDRDEKGLPKHWSILLSEDYPGGASPLEVLKGVLILKRLLSLNSSLPLTLKDFRVGRQIIFPTEEDIQTGFHVIDNDTAQLFYEVMQYYRAFEQEFNQRTRAMTAHLEDLQRK
jgi:type II secretory pathway component GspD/PulD (secretin)